MINAPVLHVNGDHPEGKLSRLDTTSNKMTTHSCRKMWHELSKSLSSTETTSARYLLAISVFDSIVDIIQKDIVVDLIVYRRW